MRADFPLVVAANRDEFHARPSAGAARWPDAPQVIGGRDLEAGGTWLGISDSGRFAAVTNVRETGMAKGRRSRGTLTADFLRGDGTPLDFAANIDGDDFSGFNLLLADGESLVYRSNRDGAARHLPPGIYGLSNHRLDTPWPKLTRATARFAQALAQLPDQEPFFALLAERTLASDAELPDTGVPVEWERLLSAIFVQSPDYGTRASTLAWQAADGSVGLHERRFAPDGTALQSSLISTAV